MNGIFWRIFFVPGGSSWLIERSGRLTVATTDPSRNSIYISEELYGDFLTRVLLHELGHVTMFSYGLIDDLHAMVRPEFWNAAEEWCCNFIADYGRQIFDIAYQIVGGDAWRYVPPELEKMIS